MSSSQHSTKLTPAKTREWTRRNSHKLFLYSKSGVLILATWKSSGEKLTRTVKARFFLSNLSIGRSTNDQIQKMTITQITLKINLTFHHLRRPNKWFASLLTKDTMKNSSTLKQTSSHRKDLSSHLNLSLFHRKNRGTLQLPNEIRLFQKITTRIYKAFQRSKKIEIQDMLNQTFLCKLTTSLREFCLKRNANCTDLKNYLCQNVREQKRNDYSNK